MADPRIRRTLIRKDAEILGRITACEAQIVPAKPATAHVTATIERARQLHRRQAR